MILENALILFVVWLFYGLSHSLLASGRFKNYVKNWFPGFHKSYRLFYIISSCLLFFPPAYYQWHLITPTLWVNPFWLKYSGLALFLSGIYFLKKSFKNYDSPLFSGLKKEDTNPEPLVQKGILGIIRHPLYTSTLIIVWGYFLYRADAGALAFALAIHLYILVGIYWEEKKLIHLYGDEYIAYRKKTPMLIPNIRLRKN